MLISFDLTIGEIQSVPQSKLRHSLEELLRSHRRGYHLVVIDRDVAQWIQQHVQLGAEAMSTCAEIRQAFTQTGNLSREAAIYVRLVHDRTKVSASSPSAICCDLSDISKNFFLDRTALIVEDAMTDGKLIRSVADFAAKRGRFLPTNFELIHAGGDRLPDILKEKLDEDRIILVVLDSDKRSPGGVGSSKLSKVETILAGSTESLARLLVLQGREIENCIPRRIIAELSCSREKGSLISFHERVEQAENSIGVSETERLWLYFDLKEGLKPITSAFGGSDCDKDWMCKKVKLLGLDPEQVSIQGFGSNVVPLLLRDARTLQSFLKETLTDSWLLFSCALFEALWLGVAARRSFV